jgi:molecular chaperone DnaK
VALGWAVGIDLGTTTSLSAIGMPDGMPRLLRDPQGHGIIPSVVSILPDSRILVGQRAKDRIVLDPENTFFSTKRFIGRDMRLEENSWAAAAYPFHIHPGENGVATVMSRGRSFTLTDVGAMILAYLKKISEQATGLPVPRAVVTVPANFNDVQRSTTHQAGERAGFEVLRIINEPTAAALAYGLESSRENERIAVYDFGGGTFDMTILEVRGEVYEVLATAGNTMLGGDDFDRRILDRMVKAFQEQTGCHPRESQEFHQKLFLAAERIKCQLSDWLVAGFTERGIEVGGQRHDFHFELSREQFVEACGDLVDMSFDVCDEALRLAECTLTSIDQIILVGGTTRIPVLRDRVTKYFLRPPLDKIQPDTVVALGAAIQAYALAGGPAMWPSPERMPGGTARWAAAEPVEPATRIVQLAEVDAEASARAAAEEAEEPTRVVEREAVASDAAAAEWVDRAAALAETAFSTGAPRAAPVAPPAPPSRAARYAPVMPKATPAPAPAAPRPVPPGPPLPPPLPAAPVMPPPLPPVPPPLPIEVEAVPLPRQADPRMTLEPPRGLGVLQAHPASPAGGVRLPVAPAVPAPAMPALAQEAMASILSGGAVAPRPAPVLLDVTPLTLGIQTVGGNVEPIIKRNSQVPIEQSRLFATTADDQTTVVIRVCQGESRKIEDNVVLGEMRLEELPPSPRGKVTIRVAFEINTDGIFSATAVDTKTSRAQRIRLTLFGG